MYQTGSATSAVDLLQKLVTFLTANGWALNSSITDGVGGWRAHLNRSGTYANLRATLGSINPWAYGLGYSLGVNDGGLHLYLGTGYDGAQPWNAQAGGPIVQGQTYNAGVSAQTLSGALTAYHFFTQDGGDSVQVVIERSSGFFVYVGWGLNMSKAGVWTGGTHFYGSCAGYYFTAPQNQSAFGTSSTAACPFTHGDGQGAAGAFVRADVDTFTGKWLAVIGSLSVSYGYTGRQATSGIFGSSSYNPPSAVLWMYGLDSRISTMNNAIVVYPIRIFAPRDAGGWSLLGEIPNVFDTKATQFGFSPASELLIASDTYKIFPYFALKKV